MTSIVEQVMQLEEELERIRADNAALRTSGQTTEIEHLNELLKQVTAERDEAQAALEGRTQTSTVIELFDMDVEITLRDLEKVAEVFKREGWVVTERLAESGGGIVGELVAQAFIRARDAEEKERAATGRALQAEQRTREIEAEYNRSVEERVRLKAERDAAVEQTEKAGVLWAGPADELHHECEEWERASNVPGAGHGGRVILLADPRADETEKLKRQLDERAKDWAATRARTEGIDVIGPVAWEASRSGPDGTVISFVQTGRVGRYEFNADTLSIHTDDDLLKADALYRLVHLPWETEHVHVLLWQNDD